MKYLYLIRHAKSSWDEPFLSDHDRPLARRGRKAAPRVGAHMANMGWIPESVLCSSARRAVETWDLVSMELDQLIRTETTADLYHASPSSILDLLRALPDDEESVLLVGHNPTFEDLTLLLAVEGNQEALSDVKRKYPTGALAVVDLPIDSWAQIRGGEGALRAFIRPRTLGK